MHLAGKVGSAAFLALALVAAANARETMPDGDWRTINRDLAATRYSPLKDIDRGNVSRLAVAWSYPMKAYGTAVPLVVGSVMYFPAGNRVVALDADSGQEIWVHTVAPDPTRQRQNVSTRGVGYWPGDAQTPARILVMVTQRMLALDAKTGEPVAGFGDNGFVDVGVGYGGTPTISGDIAVIGAATLENPVGVPGNPRAFDARTGKKLWEFQTVPLPGQMGHDTWGDGWKGRSGTNMWAFSAPVDEDLGLVFVPISSPSPNYYRGDAPGANLFGNSLVALDLKTGQYRWHFQTVHHDIWDSDMSSAGPLLTLKVNGQPRPAIAQVGKTSLFFEFDRATGKPLIDVKGTAGAQGRRARRILFADRAVPGAAEAAQPHVDDDQGYRDREGHDARACRGVQGAVGQERRVHQQGPVHPVLLSRGRHAAPARRSSFLAVPAA